MKHKTLHVIYLPTLEYMELTVTLEKYDCLYASNENLSVIYDCKDRELLHAEIRETVRFLGFDLNRNELRLILFRVYKQLMKSFTESIKNI